MSRTVSFRASEELDEFLEQEAERRMTTKSTVSQMLLAERVRQLKEERDGDGDLGGSPDQSARPTSSTPFDDHPEKWYRPDSNDYEYVVRLPGGDRNYYKTERGAAERLEKEYGEE